MHPKLVTTCGCFSAKGQSLTLKANVDVNWSSSNDAIVSVDQYGNILGKKEGDRVYVESETGEGYYVVIKKLTNTNDDSNDKIKSF